jgi:hypothetical protein
MEERGMAVAQQTGTLATLAILAAIGGMVATFTGHPVWGLIIDLVAIPLGIGGLLTAASPRVRGGVLSIIAIVAAVIGLGLAGLGMIGTLVF